MDNESRSDATKSKLIDAAIETIAEKGYHRTSFVEICRRSGLSRGAIHHHFDSVPSLMTAVVQEIGNRLRAGTLDQLSELTDGVDVFARGIDLVWSQLNTTNFRALTQIRTALSTDDAGQDTVREEVYVVQRWLHRQADALVNSAKSHPTTPNRHHTQIVLMSLAGAAMVDMATGPGVEDPDRVEFRDTLKQVVELMVQTP